VRGTVQTSALWVRKRAGALADYPDAWCSKSHSYAIPATKPSPIHLGVCALAHEGGERNVNVHGPQRHTLPSNVKSPPLCDISNSTLALLGTLVGQLQLTHHPPRVSHHICACS
jgi:hypothetical protein